MSQSMFGHAPPPRKSPGLYRRTVRRVKAVGYLAAGFSIAGMAYETPVADQLRPATHAHHVTRHAHHVVRHVSRQHHSSPPAVHHQVVHHVSRKPSKPRVYGPTPPYLPDPGRIFGGVTGGLNSGDYTSFTKLIGQHAPVWQIFQNWHMGDVSAVVDHLSGELSMAHDLGTRLAISLTTNGDDGREQISPQGIAQGKGDAYILGLNQAIAASGDIVYVRPFGEMDLADNPYSAFSRGGPRGSSHSTANFRKAWQRLVLIVRGGSVADMDHRLARLGMPPVQTGASSLPGTRTAFIWCPQVAGGPDVPGNQPSDYWPGSSYVDWVGADFFSGFPNWQGLDQFYGQFGHLGKPFAFGEYSVFRSGDDPSFFNEFFSWVRSHPDVRMLLYNQGNYVGGQLRLQGFPKSAAAIRQGLRSGRFQPGASL